MSYHSLQEREMKQYTVTGDLLQKLLNYLASKPYAEVFELVQAIQTTSVEVPGSGAASGASGGSTTSAAGTNGSGASTQAIANA
jgi:hypothetical protein